MLNKKQIIEKVDAIDGWLNPPVVHLLYSLCSNLKEPSKLVEIGSWKGKSSILLSLASPEDSIVFAIDPHIGSHEHKELYGQVDTFEEFKQNLLEAGVNENVRCIRKFSRDAVDDIPDKIDLLWIDGSHDYKDVKDDFLLYFPKLRDGGVVAWHDYKWQGVKQFTWELLETFDQGMVRRVEDTHYFKKTSPSLIYKWMNRFRLFQYKLLQVFKRHKRKLRKYWRKKINQKS
jgi:predicted O-methyltransferase YrrM